DDMALLRHGAMGKIFRRPYAPSTLGSFLRTFTFGHVRQLDAVASRLLINLTSCTPVLGSPTDTGTVFVDVDDTIVEVHGHKKQGASFGYTKVRGLNALLATITSTAFAPVIGGVRLRKGSAGSARGADRLITDVLALIRRTHLDGRKIVVRGDAAFYSADFVAACAKAGADVSITVRMDPAVRRAIASIEDHVWEGVEYPNAIFDETTNRWISNAEVAEVPYTAFTSRSKAKQVAGRLVVRRIPELNPKKKAAGQDPLFDLWRYHAFFTSASKDDVDTVAADKNHRAHAVIENVHADMKNSALAHMPSGKFTANAAWTVLATIAFNLARAGAALTEDPKLVRATTATIRRTLVHVPARVASRARRLHLYLPTHWPWQKAWERLYTAVHAPNTRPAPI
ncbi:MAG TPA: IS1380 family transposase, partial [Beutenbergiaceae bacterium]|nr:IS1380 family transposase [Beutenbergiaceae bacterium]